MTSLKTILIAYLVGGVTFIPLVVFGVLYYIYQSLPEVDENGQIIEKKADPSEPPSEEDNQRRKLLEEQENQRKIAEEALKAIEDQIEIGVDAYMAGWLTVSREFPLKRTNGWSSEKNTTLNETAYTSIYKHLMDRKQSVAMSSASPDVKAKPKPKKHSANTYFAILRHGNLFLYDSPEQMNVQQVIVLANHNVSLWPPDVPDGQLFIRRHSICLAPKRSKVLADELESISIPGPPKNAYFLFSDNCSEKEDFYFALLRACKRPARRTSNGDGIGVGRYHPHPDPLTDAYPLQHEQEDIVRLIQTLHSSDSHIQTMWLNALLGRLFLALHKTAVFEDFIKSRIETKLSRVNRPSFLGDITVAKVHSGGSPPYLTNPKLKELNKDGLMTLAADLKYEGDFSVDITTKATLNFGSRFKTREVSLVLSVAFKSLDGRVNLTIKPPPSNRIWYCFESMPKLRMVIEPVVSSRQITYSMVTRVIENRINDALRDSLVAPYMDDLAFFDTETEHFRGGIWDRKVRQTTEKADNAEEPASPMPVTSPVSEPQDIDFNIPSELRHHPDNLSISSSVSVDSDRRSLYDDNASVTSQELKYRKSDIFGGSDEESLRRKRVSGAFSAASAPAIVGTDRVNIVVVDGQVVTRHQDNSVSQYSSPSGSPSHRSSSRSSIRSSVSRSEGERVTNNSLPNSAVVSSDNVSAIDDDTKSITSVETTRGGNHLRSDSASTRTFSMGLEGGEERVSLSESVKKWSNKYFTSAKKSVSARINTSSGMSSSNPTTLREDQIQKKIIESRLAQADEVLMNAPRPHTYPPNAIVSPDLPDSTTQSAEELNEGPSIFAASSPRYNPTFASSSQYGPTKMHIPGSVAHPPSSPGTTSTQMISQPIPQPPTSPNRRKLPSESGGDSLISSTGTATSISLSRSSSLTLTGNAPPPPPPPSLAQYNQAPSEPRPYAPPSTLAPTELVIAAPTPSSGASSPTTSPPATPSTTSRPSSGNYDVTRTQSYARRKPLRKALAMPSAEAAADAGPATPTIASTNVVQTTSSPMPEEPELIALSEHTVGCESEPVPSVEDRSRTPLPPANAGPEGTIVAAAPSSPPPAGPAEQFDMPPVSFVDLVDEGNSFGLGAYDFNNTHPDYSSSPTNSSSVGSTSWMERRGSISDTVDAKTKALPATEETSASSSSPGTVARENILPDVGERWSDLPNGGNGVASAIEPSSLKALSKDATVQGTAEELSPG
ncbi:hypothetical protein V1517DRAFT_73368 [Lipomyces orientalis]|uniref:Uncharacterized protein n=1 Tax=Lipomyces orientalis TaxID=1233043 RepID=A0ACC3TSB2_9ASCO